VQLTIDRQRDHYCEPLQFPKKLSVRCEDLRGAPPMTSNAFQIALLGIGSSLLTAAMSVQAAVQRAPDSDPIVPSVSDLRLAADLSRATQLKPVVLGKQLPVATGANPSDGCRTDKPIQDVTLDVELLLTRSPIDPNTPIAAFGPAVPLSKPQFQEGTLVSIPIEGQVWKLLLAGRTTDLSRGVVHVTALSPEADTDFARFTIDAVRKIAVGTLVLRGSVYRIVPDSTGYSVYKFGAADLQQRPERYRRVVQNCGRNVVSELERRHVQMEVLADVQPWRARILENAHNVLLQGGSLGSMPSTDEAVNILEALRALEPLIPTTKDTTVRVTDIFGKPTRNQARAIRFEQVIGDVSVERRNEIRVDPDGKISEIHSSIVDSTVFVLKPMISEEHALVRAREALELQLGIAGRIKSTVPPELKYHFLQGATLAPMYRFGFDSIDTGDSYSVLLDATSGATEITSMAVH